MIPEFTAATTAITSMREENNGLKYEVAKLNALLTTTFKENDELKTKNAELIVTNEKIKKVAAKDKHEAVTKWKEEHSLKARIAELEKTVAQQVSIPIIQFVSLHSQTNLSLDC